MKQIEPGILGLWTARKLRPVTLLHVAAVFAAFMALAYFVFHSLTAVKTLAIAAGDCDVEACGKVAVCPGTQRGRNPSCISRSADA